ncbi:MAG: hypothetical protein LBM98_10840 [Oscillospiraceae bacterium]|jgi:hypothetical protein|nr:hypothetical protein [Oscillospiraceae bacterium]
MEQVIGYENEIAVGEDYASSPEALDSAELSRENRMRDIDEFLRDYPEVAPREIPEEVWNAVNKGKSLVSAYLLWENSQLRARNFAEFERETGKERSTGSRSGVGQPPGRDEFASALLS